MVEKAERHVEEAERHVEEAERHVEEAERHVEDNVLFKYNECLVLNCIMTHSMISRAVLCCSVRQ
jgi:hypothetical protein